MGLVLVEKYDNSHKGCCTTMMCRILAKVLSMGGMVEAFWCRGDDNSNDNNMEATNHHGLFQRRLININTWGIKVHTRGKISPKRKVLKGEDMRGHSPKI